MIAESAYRLSPQQRHRWRVAQLGTVNAVTEVCALIDGTITDERLEQALGEIVAAHEILRTVFRTVPGMKYPLQAVQSALGPKIQFGPQSGLERSAGFDLEAGPMLQARIGERRGAARVLHLVAPALCADSYSMVLLLRGIAASCRSAVNAGETVQYADYAGWLNQLVDREESAPGREFWRNVLDSTAARSKPIFARRVSHEEPAHFGSYRFVCEVVPGGPADTEPWFLPAIWAFLLARHCDSPEVLFGMTHRGRTQRELANAVGPFERCLPIDARLEPFSEFRDFALQLERQWAEAEGWQDCFDPHGSEPAPVVTFETSSAPGIIECDGYEVQQLSTSPEKASLHLRRPRRGASSGWEIVYDTREYTADAAAELAVQFSQLVSFLTANPRTRLHAVPLVGVRRFQPAADLPASNGTILDLVEHHARKNPSHPAVVSGDRVLTYADLDRLSRAWAPVLHSLGVGPGSLVPVFIDRVPEFLVAFLAILRAAAVCVPLDASYPPTRIEHILDQTDSQLLLTSESVQSQLPAKHPPVVLLDNPPEGLAPEPAPVSEDELAYVIFTSGSTGSPKGVEVDHRSLLASTTARDEIYGEAPERLLLLASFAFDSSVAGIFWTLAGGGTLFLTPSDSTRDPRQMAKLIELHRITHIQALPSWYQALLQEPGRLDSLKAVTVAGEICQPSLVDRHLERLASTLLVNEYGPTESTVWSTAYRCVADSDARISRWRVPLGRAAAHVTVRIVDSDLREVPSGIAGEIAIGGVGLARGYRNDPSLTADRFRPDPDPVYPGSRIYRSGDRGFRQADGTLEFLGRADEQVKIRGVRVEPAEIESALLAAEGVREACVVALGDHSSRQLHAFVTAHLGQSLAEAALRNALRAALPEPMVPARVSVVAALPRTPNGKIDRVLLRTMGSHTRCETRTVPPETPTQKTLADIWCSVMRIESVGIHDNFFDLGGDSIQILRIRAEAAKRGLVFELRKMLEHPTIAGLEQAVAGMLTSASPPPPAPFTLLSDEERTGLPPGLEDAYPMTALQQHMVRQSELAFGCGLYHDVMTCHLRVPVDIGKLRLATARVFERHPVLRTCFGSPDSPRRLQHVYHSVSPPVEFVDWRSFDDAIQEKRLAEFLAAEPRRQFDPSSPPMIRLTVHLRSGDTCQVTWTSHHAILDGWSASSLAAETIREYLGLPAGVAPPFSEFVRLELEASEDDQARAFWREYLHDATPTRIGTVRNGSPVRTIIERPLPAALVGVLTERATEEGVPLRTVLLSAHTCALARFTQSTEVVTGLFAHGRTESPGADTTLGLFLNFLPLRLRRLPSTWRESVRAVAAEEAAMFPYRRSSLPTMESANIYFDATFNYVHFYNVAEAVEEAGISVFSTRAINLNEFAWNTVFRRNPEGLSLELHFDPARIEEQRAGVLARGIEGALHAIAGMPDAPTGV